VPGLIPLYVVSALSSCLLAAAVVHERFIDLRVYRAGGEIALHGGDLSRAHFGPLPFTYPPFAAAVLAPLAVPSWLVARIVMTAASVIALPLVLFLALRLPPAKSWLDRRDAGCLALVAAAAAVWLEPVRTMLGLGQVDMLLALAVLADLALPASSRFKGALTGIAAGIKLTPAIFIVYFLITKRYRAAATAVIAFAATVAIGFAILPASSANYWNGTFLNPRRIGSVQSGQNVSLLGAIIRTLHHTNVADVWLPVAILLAAFGLTLAARAQRVGDEALGFSACAITGCSPCLHCCWPPSPPTGSEPAASVWPHSPARPPSPQQPSSRGRGRSLRAVKAAATGCMHPLLPLSTASYMWLPAW